MGPERAKAVYVALERGIAPFSVAKTLSDKGWNVTRITLLNHVEGRCACPKD